MGGTEGVWSIDLFLLHKFVILNHNLLGSMGLSLFILISFGCFAHWRLLESKVCDFSWFLMNETGESNLKVIAVHASVHLPYDHNLLVQNLSTQVILLWLFAFMDLFAFFVIILEILSSQVPHTNKLQNHAYLTQLISSTYL